MLSVTDRRYDLFNFWWRRTLASAIFHQDWLGFAKSIHSCATVDVYAHPLVITGIDLDGNIIDRTTISIGENVTSILSSFSCQSSFYTHQ